MKEAAAAAAAAAAATAMEAMEQAPTMVTPAADRH
jgi:hypothetical protein